ncbi:cytochrome c biogenesis protein ResB [Herbaspirillum sp. alder98]|uniref:cytochrome c biogenesis protein ResB n=1 Tax=Herbaspirillum sp. alder98 TaxID=2913096 RepID=UPI001CD8A226|nr:cytochrome c biogenesis protein ResB [Herbaspirillum sp. alder98]MCA1325700.1 cytochrome c biogenesis protein ResB [Herbaspirillum sp. alder98]
MTTGSTEGILIKTRQRWLGEAVELVSSMRFAISLLTLIAIASVIGTVMKQNEPMPNYVNQFGPFWFEVFNKAGLYAVYSAWWFLLIMGFLVLSTSLCIARNAPKMLRDMRSWRDNVREQSLRNFHHRMDWNLVEGVQASAARLAAQVRGRGYKVKLADKDGAVLIAAKQGAANKLGYIFAHAAIVIICLGGLLDSDLPIRFQQWFYGKAAFNGNGIISQIPERYRLGLGNPTFRGNTLIPEGASSSTAIIPQKDGVMIQDLPFTIQLKRFIIEFYSTGMPKLFASEVVVRDHETGRETAATIKVNEPLIYNGIALYQSSFEDGGSKLKLNGYAMRGGANTRFELAGEVNGSTPLAQVPGGYTVEWSGFRPFNVENMNNGGGTTSGDARAVNVGKSVNRGFMEGLDKHLGSSAKNANSKDFKNVGPTVQYKLRDQTGQAREYLNYMQSMQIDGAYVFLAGMREQPDQPFRYLRIPADENDSMVEWMRLRAALANPQLRQEAARRYAQHAISSGRDTPAALREQLQQSAQRGLDIFAGDGSQSGFIAVTRFLEKLPAAEQEKAADIFMKILNGSMWELWQAARAKDGQAAVASDEANGRFLQLSINALADAGFYPAPVLLQLTGFEEIKASVLQVTRSPGKKVVYFGCLLLVLGVFAMLYIRERRLWIWIKPGADGQGSQALMAMSTQRRTLDFDREFEQMKARLAPAPASPGN